MKRNGDWVKSLYEAAGRGDFPTFLSALDPQIEWREADGSPYAEAQPFKGPDAVGGVLGKIGGDVDGFAVIPQNVIDAGDTVVVEGRYRGTVKATGKPLDAQFAHIWRIAGGKVVAFQQYTDTRQWAEALNR